jgi:DNA mismatch endonuclease (patch repair protein)
MDCLSKEARSGLASRIRSKDTKPEIAVRSLLHRMGYRFKLHRKDRPGRPGIVLPRHRKIILVHGCFWHGHDCTLGSRPKTNEVHWRQKIDRNQKRDREVMAELRAAGWNVLELWECEIRRCIGVQQRIEPFMRFEP